LNEKLNRINSSHFYSLIILFPFLNHLTSQINTFLVYLRRRQIFFTQSVAPANWNIIDTIVKCVRLIARSK